MPHFRRVAFVGIVLVAALAGAGAFTGPGEFSYIPIDYPGATATYAYSINEQGTVVGTYLDSSTGDYRAFWRSRNGVYSTVDYSQVPMGVAADINARGDIVGVCDADQNGCLLREGVLSRISYPDANRTGASGINARGDVVGGYYDAGWWIYGFLLRDGVFTRIEAPGGIATSAQRINARGDIVGAANYDYVPSGYLLHDGIFTPIRFPDAWGTEALDINDRGDIVGDYTPAPLWPTTHAFLLRSGRFIELVLPGSATTARGINNRGEIVGYYNDGQQHGFLATLR